MSVHIGMALMVIAVSRDEGKTWTPLKREDVPAWVIEEDNMGRMVLEGLITENTSVEPGALYAAIPIPPGQAQSKPETLH